MLLLMHQRVVQLIKPGIECSYKNVTSENGNAAVYNGNAYNTLIQNCTFGDVYNYAYSVDIMGGNNITIDDSVISGSMDGILWLRGN